MRLEVTPPDGAPYTTQARAVFSTPERRARVATPRTRLPVRIDPAMPMHIEIDRTALDLD